MEHGRGQNADEVDGLRRLLLTLALTGGSLLVPAGRPGAQSADPAGDPVEALAGRYAGLASYSDSGTVELGLRSVGGPLLTERHRFETAFRAPRNFFFRFDADPAVRDDALVIWCDGGPFQSWWKMTGVHTVHDGGRGAEAFYAAQSQSYDAANLVAPLFFPQAELYGPATLLVEPVAAGEERLDGRPCRIVRADHRRTGAITEEDRPITLWIDTETGLLAKVLVGTEPGSPPDTLDEKTFRIDAVADPPLDDERFVFTPPEPRP